MSQLGPLNMTAAIESWEVAAANGHHHARQLLAKHLASGKWVPRNLSLALTHVYGNFDIVFGRFLRLWSLHTTPHTLCNILYVVPMPIEC